MGGYQCVFLDVRRGNSTQAHALHSTGADREDAVQATNARGRGLRIISVPHYEWDYLTDAAKGAYLPAKLAQVPIVSCCRK